MEMIYKLYSVWLYENQLSHDYVLFYNTPPHNLSIALDEIFNLRNLSVKDANKKSLEIMLSYIPLIKSSDFIEVIPTGIPPSYNLRYNTYDIYWNETKSGINPHEYQNMLKWNIGHSQYSTYRINEYKEERDKIYKAIQREKQIKSVLE